MNLELRKEIENKINSISFFDISLEGYTKRDIYNSIISHKTKIELAATEAEFAIDGVLETYFNAEERERFSKN